MASLRRLLGGGKAEPAVRQVAEVYTGLRGQVLGWKPETTGLKAGDGPQVYGLLMETGYPKAVATLVTLSDGTVSLYFSNGGAMIGMGGGHDGPRKACEALLALAREYIQYAAATTEYPLPETGRTRFYFLTFDGIFTAEATERDLGHKRHVLSPLFHKGRDVITQISIVDAKLRAGTEGK